MGKPAAAVKTTRVVANPTFDVTVNVVLPLGANRHSIERVWLPEVLRLLRRVLTWSMSPTSSSSATARWWTSRSPPMLSVGLTPPCTPPRLSRTCSVSRRAYAATGTSPRTSAIRGVVAERRP